MGGHTNYFHDGDGTQPAPEPAPQPYADHDSADDYTAPYRLAPTLLDPSSFAFPDHLYLNGTVTPENGLPLCLFQDDQTSMYTMPGAFKTPDAMDVDRLPLFAPGLDFDAKPELEPLAERADFWPDNTDYNNDFKDFKADTPANAFHVSARELVDYSQRTSWSETPSALFALQTQEPSPQLKFNFGPTDFSTAVYTPEGLPSVAGTDDHHAPRYDRVGSHRTSISAAGNDLSPLTTTTSHTPSVSSLHLTQPSFFSAPQYLRSLFEQPPSLVHRGSLDVYSWHRLSIDSTNSGANAPVRNQRSLTSYLPFMGDRKLPGQQAAAEWNPVLSPQTPQHRTLIRSIFKSGSQPQQDGALENMFDGDLMATALDEDPEAEKKAKRPKRSLFNRFKGKPQEEAKDEDMVKLEESDLVMQESHSSLHSNGSHHNTQAAAEPLQSTNSGNFAQADAPQEPDYAALFQGVGKRRNRVMKSKRKPETTVKIEKNESEVSSTEKLSLSVHRASREPSLDSHLSAAVSHGSTQSAESHGPGGLSLAMASKRILGLRLLKRQSDTSQADSSSGVVEIDLESLDLPANTKILPQAKLKTKTRGRKEDKEADMVDELKIFLCGYCSRRFRRQEHLKRHFRSLHTMEKPYECPVCQKKFSRTDNLNQHLKVHKQEEEAAAEKAAEEALQGKGDIQVKMEEDIRVKMEEDIRVKMEEA